MRIRNEGGLGRVPDPVFLENESGIPQPLKRYPPGPLISAGGCFDYSKFDDPQTWLKLDEDIAVADAGGEALKKMRERRKEEARIPESETFKFEPPVLSKILHLHDAGIGPQYISAHTGIAEREIASVLYRHRPEFSRKYDTTTPDLERAS